MKITAAVATKITVNQSTSSRWLKMFTLNMCYLLNQHSQNMGKIILFILGFGWGSGKTSTTNRISLNALTVNSYIDTFFVTLIRSKTVTPKIITPKWHVNSVITICLPLTNHNNRKKK